MAPSNPLRRLVAIIWGDVQANAPWQRIVKTSIGCTVAMTIAILPALKAKAVVLIPMVAVLAHPGQRMGVMVESLLMIFFGALLGLSWALLGLFLSSLVETNPAASYTIRAIFLLVSALAHGFIRSSTPRLFPFAFFLLIISLMTIQLPSDATTSLFTALYIPILLGGGVVLVVNLSIFPELSSSYLGSSTIDALSETIETLTRATHWFVTPGGDAEEARLAKDLQAGLGAALTSVSSRGGYERRLHGTWRSVRSFLSQLPSPFTTPKSPSAYANVPPLLTTLAHMTAQKSVLRTQLSRCKAAQDEINFEVSVSALPPIGMRPISTQHMSGMVKNTIILIGACENKFIVIGKGEDDVGDDLHLEKGHEAGTKTPPPTPITRPKFSKSESYAAKVNSVRPVKEIETGSAQLLESILARIRPPVQDFEASLGDAVNLVTSCLAYCYDVPKLPSGAFAPKGILLEEVDLRIDQFTNAIAVFDARSAEELKQAAMETGQTVDFMPRMETFLVSSFILAFRDAAIQVLNMLRHARYLVDKRQRHHGRSRLWLPQYTSFRRWLSTGGESDGMVLPDSAKKAARTGKRDRSSPSQHDETAPPYDESGEKRTTDEESLTGRDGKSEERKAAPTKLSRKKAEATNLALLPRVRSMAADGIEWTQQSEDLHYALKLSIALFLVTWPAFVSSWNAWYTSVNGIWAPLQLILVFEVAIGTSMYSFVIRLIGVLFGCIIGFLAAEIGNGNRIAVVAFLVLGIVPSVYVQVATKYVKAGIVSTFSMSVVALAAVNQSTPAYKVFYMRLAAFLIGGCVAVLVEVAIAPVRARDRLVESLSASVRQVQRMQTSMAVGIDTPDRLDIRSHARLVRFNHARDKAQGALTAAETFLPFCLNEPRLKGSFKPLAPIYKEIIYVLHQIIDRMDNVVQLRRAYGSSILEDLNTQVYAYRRNVAASCVLILFSVNEALTTWLPLPQFIPSARVALLRLINRVRLVLMSQGSASSADDDADQRRETMGELDEETASLITKRKFLSWNASTAGMMEIIEYQEELMELVKLLVGVNAFRSGMLERPDYRHYVRSIESNQAKLGKVRSDGTDGSANEQGESRTSSETGVRADRLRKFATAEQAANRPLQAGPADGGTGEEEEDGIPHSLQRIGSRLRRDNTVVRRRALTVGGGFSRR
ncbi:hypothetical protein RJ55_06650 [Drechmeria coniospora]|nr:hypothetical protein RJ55_06650 [Drechmeria coniospora]